MKPILITISILISLSCSAFCQLQNGKYKYSNTETAISFTIRDDGHTITDIKLLDKKTNKTFIATGEWFEVNTSGADPGYNGPSGWYQFQTSQCNYDFNTPGSKLTLSQFDCKNGQKEKKQQLIKSQ